MDETLKRLSRARQISRLPAFPFPSPSSQPSSHLTGCAQQNFYIVRAGYVSYTITLCTSEYAIRSYGEFHSEPPIAL